MKTSVHWLNAYLDRAVDADEAEGLLTRVGFPIDGRETVEHASGGRDVQLDVEITSNRSDCLCHTGLAREVAAASGRRLLLPDSALAEGGGEGVASLTSVSNEAADLCPVYTARVIRGVKVGPSPQWLVERLEAVGLRSVNNVVDVTNHVLLELGQPLHAFDLGALGGGRIVVRRAKGGEAFVAIDGSRHALNERMLVIADADRAVAVAGVMGGLETEVGESTRDILLESARFDPLSVRATSRSLKLSSDSSFRFERGVDPCGVERASRRAAALIVELAGGEVAPGVIRAGEAEPSPVELSLRPSRASALLGVEIPADRQREHLASLGLEPELRGERLRCRVPTFRLDLKREVDLIEEVARLHGLDAIPTRERIEIEARPPQALTLARRELATALVGWGYHEAVTFSFVGGKAGGGFVGEGAEPVMIDDERRKAEPMLRPSLLPSLLLCRKTNQDLGNTQVRLFETAATWTREGGKYVERERLGLLADAGDAQFAVRELRGAMEELVERLGGEGARASLVVEAVEAAHFKPAGLLRLGERTVGTFGPVASHVLEQFDLKVEVVAAELELEALLGLYPPKRHVRALPRYPGIERDLSIIVAEQVPWQRIERCVHDARPDRLESLRFLDTYRGKPIPKGRKSVSLRMTFRDSEKTLRHEEVDPQVEAVLEALRGDAEVGAELRG